MTGNVSIQPSTIEDNSFFQEQCSRLNKLVRIHHLQQITILKEAWIISKDTIRPRLSLQTLRENAVVV